MSTTLTSLETPISSPRWQEENNKGQKRKAAMYEQTDHDPLEGGSVAAEAEGPAPEVAIEPAVTEPATGAEAPTESEAEVEAEAPEAAAAEDKPAEEADAEG